MGLRKEEDLLTSSPVVTGLVSSLNCTERIFHEASFSSRHPNTPLQLQAVVEGAGCRRNQHCDPVNKQCTMLIVESQMINNNIYKGRYSI